MSDVVISKPHWPETADSASATARVVALFGSRAGFVLHEGPDLTVSVARADLHDTIRTLRDDVELQFTQMMDICGADYPSQPERFEVVYHLLSMVKNIRIRVKVTTDAEAPVASITDLYPVAGWFERETWDCYGVYFEGNPDLRRILTDYGFQGHPFRKDFPLTGHVELRYSEEAKRVVYEPVKLAQDFRSFDFLSPWEGATYTLPGDEKAAKSGGSNG